MSTSVDVFKIYPDHTLYFPGTTVTGKVKIIISKADAKIKRISLSVQGKSTLQWKEKPPQGSDDTDDNRTRTSNIITQNFDLVSSVDFVMLQIGEHEYPFSFTLPSDAPGSKIIGNSKEFGKVEYKISSEIDFVSEFDRNTSETIFVSDYLDMNGDEFAHAVDKFDSKTVGFCCCASGPLNVNVHLDKSGFVPGERINTCVHVDNDTNKDISVKVSLISEHKLKLSKSDPHEEVMVHEALNDKVKRDEDKKTLQCLLKIPPCPASSRQADDHIRVSYKLLVVVAPSGLSFKLKIPVPITIGTIPSSASIPTFYKVDKASFNVAFPDKFDELNELVKTTKDKNGILYVTY